jgi:hypothetical protein
MVRLPLDADNNSQLTADAVLDALRDRYANLPISERPALGPTALCGLLSPAELQVLAKAKAWPLRDGQLAYVSGKTVAEIIVRTKTVSTRKGHR